MCVCMHLHMQVVCIHIYYENHKSSTFQFAEHQILHNISTLKPSGEKCYSCLQLTEAMLQSKCRKLAGKKSESFICPKKVSFLCRKGKKRGTVNIAWVKSNQRHKGMVAFFQIRHTGPWRLRLCRILHIYKLECSL